MTQEPVVIRAAAATDLPEVEELLRSYMAEALNRRWEGSLSALERDGLGREFHTLLAWRGREAVGVAFWHRVYNVHFCVVGGEICDMFVKRHYRNSGTALMLVAAAARDIKSAGGSFLRGQSDERLESLYSRCAVVVRGAECYLGGNEFDALAATSDISPRHMLRTLTFLSRDQRG
ncbi:MAG: hypothetical protein U1F48_05520 [Burkholderiales bacterium]